MIWILFIMGMLALAVAVIFTKGLQTLIEMLGFHQLESGTIGIVYKRFGRKHSDDHQIVRTHGSPGPQAATLEADRLYWRLPLLYRVKPYPRTRVPPGTVGVVLAKAGERPDSAKMLADHIDCRSFEDGETFLRNGGQMGRQPAILPGGASYSINPELFEVVTVDTIRERRRSRRDVADERPLARQIADLTRQRDTVNAQLAQLREMLSGLANTGETELADLARQRDTLNDQLAELYEMQSSSAFPSVSDTSKNDAGAAQPTLYGLTDEDLKEVSIPEGTTGVVIALEGAPPDDEERTGRPLVGRKVEGHESFQRPWAFLANGGQKGAQAETLKPGAVYRINPWFVRHVLIPTSDLTLQWTSRDRDDDQRYASFGPIRINIQGIWLHCDLTQVIRIPAKAAGKLVGNFGEQGTDAFGKAGEGDLPVRRFVERVLGRTVEGYFESIASEYDDVGEFLRRHKEELRLELETQVRQALDEWDVEAVRTVLTRFVPEDEEFNAVRKATAEERERQRKLKQQRENLDTEVEIERLRIGIDRERRKSGAAELEEVIRLLGRDQISMERLTKELAAMGVPQQIIGDPGALREALPLLLGRDMVGRLLRRTDGEGSSELPSPGSRENTPPLDPAEPPPATVDMDDEVQVVDDADSESEG